MSRYIMNKRGFLVFSLLLLSLLFLIPPSKIFAQEVPTVGANLSVYIPPTGSECNINVPSQYSTIQAAINAANPGDTVCIGPGVYNENLWINEKAIRLSGSGAAQTIINTYIYTRGGNFTIEGFLIRGTDGNISAVDISHDDGYGVTIQYNWIEAANGSRALIAAGTHYLFQNNVFEGNNSPVIAAVGEGENNNFLSNTFIGTTSNGVVLGDGSDNSTIKDNIFKTTGSIQLGVIFASWSNFVNENNIYTDARYKVYNYPDLGVLNAENNWWGVADPGGQYVTGDVDYIPFALAAFPEYSLPHVPPQANAGRDQIAIVGGMVNFDGSLSRGHPGGPEIVSYNWDFGDGNTGSGITTAHTYTNSGLYNVTLTVTDSGGFSDSDSLMVRIIEPISYQTAAFYDFNNGSTDGWLFGCSISAPWLCGNWRVENGALVQDSGFDGVIATIADRQFSDQTVETDININGISGSGGINLWAKDNDYGVMVGFYAGTVSISYNINGIQAKRTVPYNFHYGIWYQLKVVADATSGIVDVYINGDYILSYTVTLPNRVGKTGISWGNAGGSVDNFRVSVPLVLNQPPVANAGPDQIVFMNDVVNFDGSSSTDPDGNQDIVSYNWDFGDGNTGSGVTATHTYSSSGTYTVTLTVTDTAGATNSDSIIVTVQTPAQAIQNTIELVQTFNLQQGIENSLDTKLQNATDSLNAENAGNRQDAINKLNAFISAAQAQSGTKLTVDQANTLIQKAQEIISHI